MKRISHLTTGLAAMLVLAGCDDTTPAGLDETLNLSQEEAVQLAGDLASMGLESTAGQIPTGEQVQGEGPSAVVVEFTNTFTITSPCPLAGGVVVEGSIVGRIDTELQTADVDVTAATTHDGCMFQREEGPTITVDGAPNLVLTASHSTVAEQPVGLQTVSLVGAFEWATSDERAGLCEINVSTVFDPEANTRTTEGSVCGHTFSVVETWRIVE